MSKRNPRITDEQVEQEIKLLERSPAVKLARKKINLDYKRRKYLYQLRDLEKRGIALMEAGITSDLLDEMSRLCDLDPKENHY